MRGCVSASVFTCFSRGLAWCVLLAQKAFPGGRQRVTHCFPAHSLLFRNPVPFLLSLCCRIPLSRWALCPLFVPMLRLHREVGEHGVSSCWPPLELPKLRSPVSWFQGFSGIISLFSSSLCYVLPTPAFFFNSSHVVTLHFISCFPFCTLWLYFLDVFLPPGLYSWCSLWLSQFYSPEELFCSL